MATEFACPRLVSIIEYAQQSALMKSTPVASVDSHQSFALWEKDAQGRIGINVNPDATAEDDERWLVVERLHQSVPPPIESALLKPWVELQSTPDSVPKLRQAIHGHSLISAGTHRDANIELEITNEPNNLPAVDPDSVINLDEYNNADQVGSLLSEYLVQKWNSWAELEREIRKTITLYSKLFTLLKQLEDGIIERTLELAWGIGVGVWKTSEAIVSYPLITRLVELSLNETNGDIEIRPRDTQPRLELDWYAKVENQGVSTVERAGKEFFQNAMQTLSPFDRGSFEPLLRTAVTHLDSNGAYWPDHNSLNDRSVPKSSTNLVITDTWVLFARPRSSNILIQDLERFKIQLDENPSTVLPGAVSAIVTDPATTNEEITLPEFRGVSMSGGDGIHGSDGKKKMKDLFFPKPFNDEQVRIVQLLEVSDGVVVQGPPGTGKTHTIANVISHYLANGKRVLVTSMKDPALMVLHNQLPDEIKPLAISLLSTEKDGMKQFEYAIQKIAYTVQSINRIGTACEIALLESSIDSMHGQIARLDYEITNWAKINIEPIELDGEQVRPEDAAREVVAGNGQYEWLEDKIDTSSNFAPKISNEDIVKLRAARRTLGKDINYLGAVLPSHGEFPESQLLLQVHQDLIQFEKLKEKVEGGQVPCLVDSSQKSLTNAAELLSEIETLGSLRKEIASIRLSWSDSVHDQIVRGQKVEIFKMLDTIGHELIKEKELQKIFLLRPVDLPAGFEDDQDLLLPVINLSSGQNAFGIMDIFGKKIQKQMLKNVSVLGQTDLQGAEVWKHVVLFLEHRKRLRQLAIRWNALTIENGLDTLAGTTPEHGFEALQQYQLFEQIQKTVWVEESISKRAMELFPNYNPARDVSLDKNAIGELARAISHHLTKNRLSTVWATKEKFQRVLNSRTGDITIQLRRFLAETLGNHEVDDAQMQAQWTSLMVELARVQGLSEALAVVKDITERIAESGAPLWAAQCRMPLMESIDPWLPDNWQKAWRLNRLASHLESIDSQHAMRKLSGERSQLIHNMARKYEESVSKRTWLKLAENATPNIRAALAAYLTAIQKIGKGTGKRAVHHRQHAREAATAANPAIPCWIMPHHRISESLPQELGCFDLVIIDEASQSDLTALPALLRAKKVLIVGDDKQVSPEGVGIAVTQIVSLMERYLKKQVPLYRPQLAPDRSLYDLFKVVFARNSVMLQEHFRCVPAIIEYSKREFYNHELRPIRIPRSSERLDPPLVDILIEDGFRDGDLNRPEAEFMVNPQKPSPNIYL